MPRPRSLQLGLFVAGLIWLLAARMGAAQGSQGIATRLNLPAFQPLLNASFLLFLLLFGFTVIDWIGGARDNSVRETNALPERETAAREWQLGTVLGWSALLFAVLPMAAAGSLHPQFFGAPRFWGSALLSLLTLLIGTLAVEVGFRGYLYRRLIGGIGSTVATIVLCFVYAYLLSGGVHASGLSMTVTLVAGILFSTAYLRTHALWLGWGLHFAWAAAMGVLFGLPVGGLANFSSLVSTDVSGPAWLTGGAYGPEGAFLTMLALAGATVVLYRKTRDYAWSYTHPTIVPGAYAVHVPPPPAHAAMEAAPAPTSGLVQILAAPPSNAAAAAPEAPEAAGDVSTPRGSQ